MTSEASNQMQRILSFSRRMENLGFIETDLPKLPSECVQHLLDAINNSIDKASEEGTEEFWQKFAEKCNAADIDAKHLFQFDPEHFLHSELDYIMRTKHTEPIDALEFLFRTPGMPKDLARKIKKVLESSEYHVDDSRNPISIEWSDLHVNTEVGQRAIPAVRNAGLTEAENHLQNSEEKISAGDYRGAMDECGLALESIVKVIDPSTEKKSLGECLKSPKIAKFFEHEALRRALSGLYGYLSDQVRHVGANEKRDFDKDLAVFFFGVSATFAEYLANKYRESKKT